ncbi:hypothetical protein HW132_32015, partial [Brasilonema sp. CT11]|nr:hypothetical protein [Brasilonema sp. CT11]
MKPYAGLAVLGVSVALASSLYLGQSQRPYDLISVRFCPETANTGSEQQQSQQSLDQRYCKHEQKLLKEIWEQKQFESATPLSESSFKMKTIPGEKTGIIWFLVAPVASGLAYLAWAKKTEQDENESYQVLEGFKTSIKLTTVSSQSEREFKTLVNNRAWDKQKIANGFISVEAAQDRLNRQTEIQDKQHETSLTEYDVMLAKMKKERAEALRDAAKADKETDKVLGKVALSEQVDESSDSRLKDSLIEGIKNHEDGWLWKIIENQKPIWVLGEAGSGKSTLAASIVMLREKLFDMPLFCLVDAHAGDNLRKSWKHLSPGAVAQSEEEIGQAFDDSRGRWLDR